MTTQNPQPRPQPNIPRDDEDSRTASLLVHLKDSIISQLTKLDPSVSILPHHSSHIQCHLQQLFRSFHTPTHPPYSLMIYRAITELDEGTGSTEEAISEFIKREYNDLPWAHAKILSLQLEKLCELGEIARAEGGRYVLMVYEEVSEQCSKERKRDKRRSNSGDDGPMVEQESKEKQVQDSMPPKRPRGRPRKIDTRANYPEESLLPSDDDIHNKQKKNINKMEMQHQYGKGRGRDQGGPPKLNQNAEQCEEQLEEGHQFKQQRGRGTGRGRPPKLNENPPQEDQIQQHGRGRGRERPPKLVQNTNKFEVQLPQEVQAKQQHVRGRGRGRPPKVNKNTNLCEEQLQSQDESQGLVNSPSSGRNDNQSLKQYHLRRHKSESGEAKPPPAGLRLGSKSTCGSGEVPQSNVEANQSCCRLQPVTRKVQGRVGSRFLQQNQN
ncbi:HMG-Y-related protein A, partial [Mucuna pruriens]